MVNSSPPHDASRPGWAFAVGYWWLVVVSVLFVGWGVAMAVWPDNPLLADWIAGMRDRFFGGDESPAVAEFRRFLFAVYGAALTGFYLLQLGVLVFGLRRRHVWAWGLTLAATGIAVSLEIVMSLVHGATFNIAFNSVPPLVAFAIPLALTAPAVFRRDRPA